MAFVESSVDCCVGTNVVEVDFADGAWLEVLTGGARVGGLAADVLVGWWVGTGRVVVVVGRWVVDVAISGANSGVHVVGGASVEAALCTPKNEIALSKKQIETRAAAYSLEIGSAARTHNRF